MTGGGVWDDMPVPADGQLPPPGDAAFDAVLDRAPLPSDAPAGLHQLAAAFGELHAAPVPGQPAAQQHAVAAFRAAVGQPGPARPARSRPGRRARRPRLGVRLAAIGAAAVVSLGGAAVAAAYTGVLPDVVHRLTHHPASPAASPPQPTTESRSAAPGTRRGLCTAYQHALAGGSPSQQARALRKLIPVAGGKGKVAAYCAGVVEPQPTTGGQPAHTTHPAHPTRPARPTHPAHPSHPAQASRAANRASPGQPASAGT